VTTHLRARAAQAGAFLAALLGAVAAVPAAALADPPNVEITQLVTEVPSGGSVSLDYKITNNNTGDNAPTIANIEITSGMACTDGCGQITQVDANGGTRQLNARFTAPNVADGQTQRVSIKITVTIDNEPSSTEGAVTVKGPDKPANVRQISGKVKDQDGKAISGADVAMRDSAGHRYVTTTNNSGSYVFTSSDQQAISPGAVTVGAAKDGFRGKQVQVQATAGKSVNVPLTLTTLEASPSATPSASASATAEPSDTETEETTAAPVPSGGAALNNTSANQGNGGGSMLLIVLGGLLVAAGVGTIVLVMMRRKNAVDGDDDIATGPGGPGGVVPPSQSRFGEVARVARPMGAVPGADATMVAPRSGAPSLSDAPTMLHRPVPAIEDEFPDPYGAPLPQQGGYLGTAGSNWDAQGGYAAPQQGGQYGGYSGAAQHEAGPYVAGANAYTAPGYGAGAAADATAGTGQQRYDEPTGMYRPQADNGYGEYEPDDYADGTQQYGGGYQAAGGGHQAAGGGYQAAGGYPQEQADQGGYGSWGAHQGNAYPPQSGGAYGAGAYGSAADGQYGGYDDGQSAYGAAADGYPQGGHDAQGGYPQGGHNAQGGYPQSGHNAQGGYPQDGYGPPPTGGYQQPDPSGYDEHHSGPPARPVQRRPSEWDS
jgi:carboxypeptidase family protein